MDYKLYSIVYNPPPHVPDLVTDISMGRSKKEVQDELREALEIYVRNDLDLIIVEVRTKRNFT